MSTASQLIDLLTRQGLTDPERLWDYLAQHGGPSKLPGDARQVAELLVRDGLLTAYQAQQLLAGADTPLVVGPYRLLEPLSPKTFLAERLDGRRAVVQVRGLHEPRPVTRPHRNLVAILDHEIQGDRYGVIREYIQGRSLQERLEREGPLAPVPAARAILDAARGLSHLHAAGLAHGAVELNHLIEDEVGTVRLLPGAGGDRQADLLALSHCLQRLTASTSLPQALQRVLDNPPESAEAFVALLEAWLAEVAPPPLIEPKHPSSQVAVPRPNLFGSRPDWNDPDLDGWQTIPSETPTASRWLLPLLAGLAVVALGMAGLLWWLG